MRRCVTALLIAISLLGACGSDAVEIGPRPPGETTTSAPQVLGSTREKGEALQPLSPVAAADHALWSRAHVARLWREAAAYIEAAEQRAEEVAAGEESDYSPPAAASSIDTSYWSSDEAASYSWEPGTFAGYPCGGDLPPCGVMKRESGGNPHAVNAGGCNGHGCFGLWQFSGEWDCKLGQRCGIATWSVDEQNAAARALWANGAGCSNWDACG